MRKFESIQFDNVFFDSLSNWNLKLLFKERGKPKYPKKKPLGAKERTNNKLNQPSQGVDDLIQDLNPGHIRGRRRVLSPLRHPYPSLKMAIEL